MIEANPSKRIDFRQEIQRLYDNNTKEGLKRKLAERTGADSSVLTSVTPNTNELFRHILPRVNVFDYVHQRQENAEDWDDLRKRGTALRILLNRQIGRPKYERIGNLTNRDRAEFVMAAKAYDEGYDLASGAYMPTTLPIGAEQYWNNPPSRTTLPERHLDTIVNLEGEYESTLENWLKNNGDVRDAPYGVYVLDCTPATGMNEPNSIQSLRRDIQATVEFGADIDGSVKKAGTALNQDCRIYYVGMAENLNKRIAAHIAGAHKSATDYTNLFPPVSLCELWGCETENDAKNLEGNRADEINRMERAFAHSDELSLDPLEYLVL